MIWKGGEEIINNRPRESVRLHGDLHRFHAGRGTGTAILELKMAQELESMDQETVLLFVIDMQKAYDTVDFGSILKQCRDTAPDPI